MMYIFICSQVQAVMDTYLALSYLAY